MLYSHLYCYCSSRYETHLQNDALVETLCKEVKELSHRVGEKGAEMTELMQVRPWVAVCLAAAACLAVLVYSHTCTLLLMQVRLDITMALLLRPPCVRAAG